MKNISAMTMQEQLEAMLQSAPVSTSGVNVFKSNHKPGETVFVAHFCNEVTSSIAASLRQSYKFRPKQGVIKEVIFDKSEHPIKYKIIGMASNSFCEELVADDEVSCAKICDELNQPRM